MNKSRLIAASLWVVFGMGSHHAVAAEPASEGQRRVANARHLYGKTVQTAIEQAGLHYPPGEIFVRVFKFENVLEIWARNSGKDAFTSILELPLMDVRVRGPKRREGDYGTPEGCYRIIDFNSESAGYMSLRINYPNPSDRILGDQQHPGKDIFIHGGGFSTGCITLGNPGIAQLYLLALDTQRRPINVHIFPHKLDRTAEEVASKSLTDEHPDLAPFWSELRPIYDAFETTRRVPRVGISKDGHYTLAH